MMNFPRFSTIAWVLLVAFTLSGAEEDASSTPQVLVLGENGLSEDAEPEEEGAPVVNTNIAAVVAAAIDGGAATNQPSPETVVVRQEVDWTPLLKTMEMMIEQQKLSMVALEEARANAVRSAEEGNRAMQGKLDSMATKIEEQQAKGVESLAGMNRLVVGVAAGFASVGFIVMVFTGWFFMRTMNRVSEINANLQTQLLALPQMQQHLVGSGGSASNPASQRLVSALEQLEARIRDLEHTTEASAVDSTPHVDAEVVDEAASINPATGEIDTISLLSKGQTRLNLDDPTGALSLFNAVIEREPDNAEAHLRRGSALEKLRRFEDAIDAYDKALESNQDMTMAYLAKGGLCNRMERYNEALHCYEKALQTQQQATERHA